MATAWIYYRPIEGLTVRGVLRPNGAADTRWTGPASGFLADNSITNVNWSDGLIVFTPSVTADGTFLGRYVADVPAGLPAGVYYLEMMHGDTPGLAVEASQEVAWNGDAGGMLALTDVAGEIFRLDMADVEADIPKNSLGTVVLATLHSRIVGTELQIHRTDDTTPHATATVIADANAQPITGVTG